MASIVATVHKNGDTVIDADVATIGKGMFDRIAIRGEPVVVSATVKEDIKPGAIMTLVAPSGLKVPWVVPDKASAGTAFEVPCPTSTDDEFTAAQLSAALENDKELGKLIEAVSSQELTELLKSGGESRATAKFVEAEGVRVADSAEAVVTRSDWVDFMMDVRQEQLDYFRVVSLLRGKCYNGYGLTPGGSLWAKVPLPPILCFTDLAIWLPLSSAKGGWCQFLYTYVTPRGFWSDFAYFAQNNHPLLVMFFTDPIHPYSPKERQAEFIAGFATTFFGAGLLLILGDTSFIVKFFMSALFCSVPGAIIKKICWYLFAQPCLQVDSSKTSGGCDTCLSGCACLATGCGMAIVCVWATTFFIIGLVMWIVAAVSGDADFMMWLYGVMQFW